jgi:UDP-N-acetyl-2-amino-2-deoxyglucuronate dehydrogenase
MHNRKLKFGILGCGAAGALHATAIAHCAQTELLMVADDNENAAKNASEAFDVPYTLSCDELLANPDIEAVSIALPHHLHYEYSLKAGQADKHLIVEKPFTTHPDLAAQVVDLFADRELFLSVWLERRYYPFVEEARRFLREGHLGRIIYVAIDVMGYKPRAYWEYGMRFESFASDWRKKWETSGGGPLLMNGIHQLDLMRYITGLEVVEVTAQMATFYHDVEVEDTIAALFKLDNGALGRVDCTCAAYGAGRFPIDIKKDRIYGTNGYLVLGAPLETYDRIWHHRKHDVAHFTVTDAKILAIGDFAQSVLKGKSTHLAHEILQSHKIIKAMYHSARTGKAVALSSKGDN